VNQTVLDSSVVVKWFTTSAEEDHDRAMALQAMFVKGQLHVIAPRVLMLELMNAAARRWRWTVEQLTALAEDLAALRFELVDPHLKDVARWAARGLSAYDAAFVAVAEAAGVGLVTADRQMVDVAGPIARLLSETA
jgi:predicted nucleic acid-binding protein